jgi:hypothetical protein
MATTPFAILEDTAFTEGVSARDNAAAIEAARVAGFSILSFSSDFEIFFTADEAFDHVPEQTEDTPGVWVGFIPSADRYERVHGALARRRIFLPNSPAQHLKSMEFDRYYDAISDLTAESRLVTDPSQAGEVASALGLPLFVKGSLQSAKARGWGACVARDPVELAARITELLADERKARGKVIVRQLLALRHTRTGERGVPQAREYRVFVLNNAALSLGPYWPGEDELSALSPDERAEVVRLATAAARRVGTPFLAVDVAQKEDGGWVVIEVGDGQFAGASQAPLDQLWTGLLTSLG